MTTITSSQILEKIGALDILVADLDAEFGKVSTDAVAGAPEAGKKAAEINQRIERLAVDRLILNRALARAQRAEAAAREAKAEAERRKHFDAAKGHAKRLLAATKRIDAAIAEITASLPEIAAEELLIRQNLGRAQVNLSVGPIGQMGLAVMAIDKLIRLADGRARLSGPGKSVTEIATSAWVILLAAENEQETA
ncbi:hypothetical protein NKI54_09950 [Mesorhizobium sp. M0663]|uniref:hypothetical protein n=1 Tax=unclassified Mesorhizobium TaxID=325217 RepID=UPI0003CEA19F|nr:hypothetical protein [Mesorhizobium sp. LSHC420B00]ESX70660.1 hypothetical protein X759_21735 [Mesorhizobium sp. LSHC420B00]